MITKRDLKKIWKARNKVINEIQADAMDISDFSDAEIDEMILEKLNKKQSENQLVDEIVNALNICIEVMQKEKEEWDGFVDIFDAPIETAQKALLLIKGKNRL